MKKLFPAVFEKYDLLNHPFYTAWNEGRLTQKQLGIYAWEYGSFIQLINKGWRVAGEEKIAAEEQEHFLLWENFADSISAEKIEVSIVQVNDLVNLTRKNYKAYASAIGALYAFEAQQPNTSTSKLQGLKKHYSGWNIDETYFNIHADDVEEPALLEEKFHSLSFHEKLTAGFACEETCRALWNALTGIMEQGDEVCKN